MKKWATLLLIMSSFLLPSCSEENDKEQEEDFQGVLNGRVIYGDDDRLDLYQVKNATLLKMASSTAALIRKNKITNNGNGTSRLQTTHFGDSYDLCPGEPFREQHTAAYCSGFLVGPDLLVTAGHCVDSASDCNGTSFVFGWGITQAGLLPMNVQNSEIYNCKEIVAETTESFGADFSVIRLDRAVVNRDPLPVRRDGVAKVNDPLIVIGHPVGLPTKVAGGAIVREVKEKFLVANLDTYGGNSGSAVFNAVDGKVEGILVRGATDWSHNGQCRSSNQCPDDGCRGEDVTKITELVQHIPALGGGDVDPDPGQERVAYADDPSAAIPDNNVNGVVVEIEADQAPNGRQVKIGVDILHTWRGDLVVTVVAPNGVEKVLHFREGRNADNINGIYGDDLNARDGLGELSAVDVPGVWKLKVSDHAFWDRGTVRSWQVEFVPVD